jgi:ribonuclease HI
MIKVYTDGSCKPTNPGLAGSSFIVVEDEKLLAAEGKYIGTNTNNVAELSAVKFALDYLKDKKLESETIMVHSDSQYVIGSLSKNWKAKANIELIQQIKDSLKEFPNLKFEWVKAHNGDEYNEMADELANAIVDANSKNAK